MSEILDELKEIHTKKSPLRNLLSTKFIVLIVIVIGFGIYVGDVLFGRTSLDVLLNLQSDEKHLENRVKDLKKENAILQKEYFELKELDPETKGEP